MATDDPVFITRDGEVWACWLNGKPAVNLGTEQSFWAAAEKLFNELHPAAAVEGSKSEGQNASAEMQTPLGNIALNEPHVERSEQRHEVSIVGRLFGQAGSREVTIFDLSSHGCMVQDHTRAQPGSIVTIKIGSVGPISAIIRWRRDSYIGLKFDNPLYPAVLEDIRARLSLR